MPKRIAAIACVVLLTLCLPFACSGVSENYVFNSFYRLEIEGNHASRVKKEAESRLIALEQSLSASLTESDVAKLNAAPADTPIAVGNDTYHLLTLSATAFERTDGAFNIAMYPLVELWGFAPTNFTGIATEIPTPAEIDALLPYADPTLLAFDDNAVTKSASAVRIDFGGLGKGYAADVVYRLITEAECDAFVNIGGTVRTSTPKTIGITDPRDPGQLSAKLSLPAGQSVSTSGDYYRYYIVDGVRYHHILDQNGYPAGLSDPDRLISATVTGTEAVWCDILSTAAFVMNRSDYTALLNTMGYSALLIDEHGSVHQIGEAAFELL